MLYCTLNNNTFLSPWGVYLGHVAHSQGEWHTHLPGLIAPVTSSWSHSVAIDSLLYHLPRPQSGQGNSYYRALVCAIASRTTAPHIVERSRRQLLGEWPDDGHPTSLVATMRKLSSHYQRPDVPHLPPAVLDAFDDPRLLPIVADMLDDLGEDNSHIHRLIERIAPNLQRIA
jgi:hypothetical protein